MSIGTRVMQMRNQKGLTQRQLSQRSGIAARTFQGLKIATLSRVLRPFAR